MSESSGYFISAPWRSSGKTIFSIGLARAAKRRDLSVQPFKKGPDFIDPLWLAAASGSNCYNLDPYIEQQGQWLQTFERHVNKHSLALVEGTMGLHDGLQSDGSDSNASVATGLELPVILVVDCRGMHRTVAALINGIQQFDPQVRFAGVVLNRIRSKRHEEKITKALDAYSDTRLLGAIPETSAVHIEEKQLGLTPVSEYASRSGFIESTADLVTQNCDLDHLFLNCSPSSASSFSSRPGGSAEITRTTESPDIKIGIARDEVFHFYYQDDLNAFAEKGIELVEVSPISGKFPFDLDGLIIGGGFPERHAQELASNTEFIRTLRSSINNGLAVHAECAGLMYLCNRLLLDEGSFDMVGIIDADVKMHQKPQGRGYMKLQLQDCDTEIRAHEFHHSELIFNTPQQTIFNVTRGHGIDGKTDGVLCANVQASYAHFRQTEEYPWVDRFVQRVLKTRA